MTVAGSGSQAARDGRRVTVVGAGVIGLTCAVRLAEAGLEVNVLARELPLETTSAVAGGLWLPYLAEPLDAVTRWAGRSLDVFRELARDPASGVRIRIGHLVGLDDPPAWAAALPVPLTRQPDPAPGYRFGWRLAVPLVEMDVYLAHLIGRLHRAGGTLTRLGLPALPRRGLVLDCTGLAARALAGDRSVRPVRGQTLRLTDPGLAEWLVAEDDPDRPDYVLPHGRHVVVGGTADDGDWSTTADPNTAARLLQRAIDLVPALRGATVLGHRVGLRPVRPAVRLEAEPGGTPDRMTVHCYGHGGSGVTLSWGCADDVLDLLTVR